MMHEAVINRASARAIMQGVAQFHGLPVSALTGQKRERHIVWPRQEACWALRGLTRLSLPAIGRLMGNRDHTTVMASIAAVERRRATDIDYHNQLSALRQRLEALIPKNGTNCALCDPLQEIKSALATAQSRLGRVVIALEVAQADLTILQSEGFLK